MAKIDGKEVIARLEFAAKAAEEFLRAFNQVKAEVEEIKPLTPYQIKKKKQDEEMQRFITQHRINRQRKIERDQEKIRETMEGKGLSWDDAAMFLYKERSQIMKQAWATRKKKEQNSKPSDSISEGQKPKK